jgi:cell division protein FtsL
MFHLYGNLDLKLLRGIMFCSVTLVLMAHDSVKVPQVLHLM